MLWIMSSFDKHFDFEQSFYSKDEEILMDLETMIDYFDEDDCNESEIKNVQNFIDFLKNDGFSCVGYHFKNHLNQFINIEKHPISFDKTP